MNSFTGKRENNSFNDLAAASPEDDIPNLLDYLDDLGTDSSDVDNGCFSVLQSLVKLPQYQRNLTKFFL